MGINGNTKNREYVFFYHYYRQKKAMSVHFRGACYVTPNVVCKVPCETKWSERQPNLIMKGKCKNIEIKDDKILIF